MGLPKNHCDPKKFQYNFLPFVSGSETLSHRSVVVSWIALKTFQVITTLRKTILANSHWIFPPTFKTKLSGNMSTICGNIFIYIYIVEIKEFNVQDSMIPRPSPTEEWFGTAQGMIEFRRCLVQALDIKSSQCLDGLS